MPASFIGLSIVVFGVAAAVGFTWVLQQRALARACAEWRSEIGTLRLEMSDMLSEFRQLESESTKPGIPGNGFNLNRRAEAVRRLRAGHAADKIAVATGWSIPEVALLQTVEKLGAVSAIRPNPFL